jgi:hypothetical protein
MRQKRLRRLALGTAGVDINSSPVLPRYTTRTPLWKMGGLEPTGLSHPGSA